MAGIGEQLRTGREAAGLTVSEIARETGVPPHFLEALERDQFYELPDPVYVRGFIRTYSRAIGLDALGLIEMLPDELRFPGSTGAIIRQPPETPPQHRQAPPVAAPPPPAAPPSFSMPPPPAKPAAAIPPAVPVAPPVVAAATVPVMKPHEDAAAVAPAPLVDIIIGETQAGQEASGATSQPASAAPAGIIIDGDVDDGVLAAMPETGRKSWFQSRFSLPLVAGAVALVLALTWLTSVIRGGGDGSLPASGGLETQTPGTAGAIGVSASPASTQTARSTVARSTSTAIASPSQAPSATATASPTPSPTASPTPSPTTAPSPTIAPTATPEPTVAPEPTPAVPPPPAVPVNAFAYCQNLGGDNYNCGPFPVRVICAPGGGRFYDPNGIVPRPIPAEWTGWRETTVSGRLEGIQTAC